MVDCQSIYYLSVPYDAYSEVYNGYSYLAWRKADDNPPEDELILLGSETYGSMEYGIYHCGKFYVGGENVHLVEIFYITHYIRIVY